MTYYKGNADEDDPPEVLFPGRDRDHTSCPHTTFDSTMISFGGDGCDEDLVSRVTAYVGPKAFPISMPSVFLTTGSKLFRRALDASQPQLFKEARSRTMYLPEEDPWGFLVLARHSIDLPYSIYDLYKPHWPIECDSRSTHCCDSPGYDSALSHRPGAKPALIFRFLAMLERLGFDPMDSAVNKLLDRNIGCSAEASSGMQLQQLVHPDQLDWALSNSLPGSPLRTYVAAQICFCISHGMVDYDLYEPQLSEHPDMTRLMLNSWCTSFKNLPTRRSCQDGYLLTINGVRQLDNGYASC